MEISLNVEICQDLHASVRKPMWNPAQYKCSRSIPLTTHGKIAFYTVVLHAHHTSSLLSLFSKGYTAQNDFSEEESWSCQLISIVHPSFFCLLEQDTCLYWLCCSLIELVCDYGVWASHACMAIPQQGSSQTVTNHAQRSHSEKKKKAAYMPAAIWCSN